MTNLASKLQLPFYEIILKLSKSTTAYVAYGKLAELMLEIQTKNEDVYFFNLVKWT